MVSEACYVTAEGDWKAVSLSGFSLQYVLDILTIMTLYLINTSPQLCTGLDSDGTLFLIQLISSFIPCMSDSGYDHGLDLITASCIFFLLKKIYLLRLAACLLPHKISHNPQLCFTPTPGVNVSTITTAKKNTGYK